MKDARYPNHDALRAIKIDLLDGTILEQIAAIRRSYRLQTKTRLKFRHATEWLSLITAGFRDEVARRPKTGFELQCPHCFGGEEDIVIEANDTSVVHCFGCDRSFTPQEARDVIAEALAPWDRYLATIAPLTPGPAAEQLAAKRQEELVTLTPRRR